jgi:hypothetical protein
MKDNILYGDIQVFNGKKSIYIKNAVFIENDFNYKGMTITKIISSKIVGQKNESKSYTEVKGSDEKRNKITGAYE